MEIAQIEEKKVQVNPKYLDVSPISKGRRMLVYLADLFINLVIAILFFSVAVYPIGRHVSDYEGVEADTYRIQCRMMDVLYDNGLLLCEDETSRYDFNMALDYSADAFLKGFLPGQDRHDFITHFYVDLLGKEQAVANEIYSQNDSRYFSLESGVPELKEEYRDAFLPLLDEKDTLSDDAQEHYDNFVGNVFPKLYSPIMTDLEESDAISSANPLYAYREYHKQSQTNEEKQRMIAVYCAYIALSLSAVVSFLVVPLVSRRGKTIGMMAMRIERIGSNSFKACSRLERVLIFPLQTIASLPVAMFVPIMYIDFATLFALPQLPYLSLITLAYVVISFFAILFDRLNRSLNDFFTRTIVIDNAVLEKIYLAKGYPL